MVFLVTGSGDFVGKHMVEALRRQPDSQVIGIDIGCKPEELEDGLARADVIFHLAGIHRPQNVEEFKTGNAEFTIRICDRLKTMSRHPLLVFSSSTQAALDNPYGVSKREAEEALRCFAKTAGASVAIFRLKNEFGKWCRPNYNSVVATFCHNISRDLPITISDPDRELELVYIDDVVSGFLSVLDQPPAPGACAHREISNFYKITLGELAAKIRSFHESRKTLVLADFADELTHRLYATYLSYLDASDFAYPLDKKTDPRGCLAEFIKSPAIGQIFVSRTNPGITRGNHYHHTKTEKFMVVEGDAIIRFRHIDSQEVIEYPISGHEFKVVDIPPGYTHSIENVGSTEMIVLFWASEIFNPEKPDTYFLAV